MKVYVDTSAALRAIFREPNAAKSWGRWEKAYSSRLWRMEAYRTVDRLRLAGQLDDAGVVEARRGIELVDGTFHIVGLSDAILRRCEETFPTTVGTLDAIHLATALAVHAAEPLDRFLTHDAQLAAVARAMGFNVEGV